MVSFSDRSGDFLGDPGLVTLDLDLFLFEGNILAELDVLLDAVLLTHQIVLVENIPVGDVEQVAEMFSRLVVADAHGLELGHGHRQRNIHRVGFYHVVVRRAKRGKPLAPESAVHVGEDLVQESVLSTGEVDNVGQLSVLKLVDGRDAVEVARENDERVRAVSAAGMVDGGGLGHVLLPSLVVLREVADKHPDALEFAR